MSNINSEPPSKPFKVFLRACLPEHEGNDRLFCDFDTREEAENWIAAQKGQFFRSGDYYVGQ